MSNVEPARRPEGGRLRAEGARAVRPRNAATLIIVRRDRSKPQVLMGKR
ncbi:MAG: NUDIX hydrolase, partial [Caulobacteraceae bacterium]